MSDLQETDSCIPDTQETYYEGAKEASKHEVISETQNLSLTESQDFHLVDSQEDDITENTATMQDGKDNCQTSIKQLDSQIRDESQLETDDKAVTVIDEEDTTIKNKELLEDEYIKKTEKDISSNVLDTKEKKELAKEDILNVLSLSSSPPPGTISNTDTKVADLKRKVEFSDELSTKISKITSEDVITNDKETKGAETQELAENEPDKETEKNVLSNVQDSEIKDELSDEDEVIQGTPPRNYSSTKSISGVEITSLKRKRGSVEELPAKISRMTEDMKSDKKFEDEESRQSCESNSSYQDLFKNTEKNVIIEETQDPTNQEFPQKSLRSPFKHITDDDKAQEHCFEQTNQEKNNVFPTKCCEMEKDENLNVSTKLADTSANNSTTVNTSSMNKSDSHVADNSSSVEMKESVSTTSGTAVDKDSKAGTSDETDKSLKTRDLETTIEQEKLEEASRVEPTEKTTDKNDEEIWIAPTEASIDVQSSVKDLNKSRSSIELIYDTGCGNKSELEIVEIDEDNEKIALDSSAEVIYDHKSSASKPEIIEIVDDPHEDGVRIVLDSLGEGLEVQAADKNESIYKSYHEGKSDLSYRSMESVKESSLDSKSATDKKLVNGSSESKRGDTDATLSVESDTFSGCNTPVHSAKGDGNVTSFNIKKFTKGIYLESKDMDNTELISISDNETSNVEEKNKSDLVHNSALAKGVQMEREIDMYVKFKCTLHMDESTKEFLSKELTAVQCETLSMEPALASKQKNEDSQSSLADISDNKESPGSVNSNPQLYHLNPSRLSIMSSISSSSSASSAASLAAKINLKNHFSMPLGPAKHAKKHSQDVSPAMSDKQALDETYERLTREWKNHRLFVTTVLNCVNSELSSSAAAAATVVPMDSYVNVSNEQLDDHHQHHHPRHHPHPHRLDHLSEKGGMRSSTPEVPEPSLDLSTTPKSTKKNKGVKRARSKQKKSSIAQTKIENGGKSIPNAKMPILHSADVTASPSKKRIKLESTSENISVNEADASANSPSQNMPVDDLIGKNVFAKWSDNNYYPGTVSDQVKTKYKVNFHDGKSKLLIPEFVIPIPKILKEGLSVYATTKTNGYGSCGIIVDAQTKSSLDEDVCYTVETDEGERLRVQVRDIFLSADQAQVLREESNPEGKISLPSTPKALGQVTLDNMMEGKRRSKRIGTPVFSTPKSKSNVGASSSASKVKAEPSVSGIADKLKKEKSALSENESISSGSNVESTPVQDECVLRGVQREIIGTPYQQVVKGPQSRIKGKPRSKKKVEDEQTIATLGPIPSANSNIFKGMSFILTCAPLDTLDRYQDSKSLSASNIVSSAASSVETEVTETETENEDEWTERPFVRDRLRTQITTGGGKVYEDFNKIPKDEYKNTKLITNVPNTTAKSILCLSVGIPACNHKWIIRCCLEGKTVNAAEDALPTGWSLQKRTYVEMFQATGNKPLSKIVVIIPGLTYDKEFTTFWRLVCENAGAVVLIAENSASMELVDFDSDVVLVSNQKCPSWAVDRAVQLRIPVLSTTWVVQCLIEGKRCPYEQNIRYKYNCSTH